MNRIELRTEVAGELDNLGVVAMNLEVHWEQIYKTKAPDVVSGIALTSIALSI
jgi:hypothetical protein